MGPSSGHALPFEGYQHPAGVSKQVCRAAESMRIAWALAKIREKGLRRQPFPGEIAPGIHRACQNLGCAGCVRRQIASGRARPQSAFGPVRATLDRLRVGPARPVGGITRRGVGGRLFRELKDADDRTAVRWKTKSAAFTRFHRPIWNPGAR
jgi:hypothetical protein